MKPPRWRKLYYLCHRSNQNQTHFMSFQQKYWNEIQNLNKNILGRNQMEGGTVSSPFSVFCFLRSFVSSSNTGGDYIPCSSCALTSHCPALKPRHPTHQIDLPWEHRAFAVRAGSWCAATWEYPCPSASCPSCSSHPSYGLPYHEDSWTIPR